MKEAIAILTAKLANIDADIAAFDQVIKEHQVDGMMNKRRELRELSEKIESAIGILKLEKEIKILEVLIDEGRIKAPND